MAKTLTLEIAGLTVVLSRFVDNTFPRIESDRTRRDLNYTTTGTIAATGYTFETKLLFDVNAFCTTEQEKLIDFIYAEHSALVLAKQSANIIVSDTTRLIRERSPRTRAIAAGTSATTETIGSTAYVEYYPKLNCWMPSRPQFFYRRKGEAIVNFQLLETDKLGV